jgi:hypothetical protein
MSYMGEPEATERQRREQDRVPLSLMLNELVGDDLHRAMAVNVSPTGFYLDRLFRPRQLQLGREDRTVQLEFTLPESTESIWALAEVCHDDLSETRDALAVHGTGVRFTAMARKHERILHDFVNEQKRRNLEVLLERIRNRRRDDRRRTDRRAA